MYAACIKSRYIKVLCTTTIIIDGSVEEFEKSVEKILNKRKLSAKEKQSIFGLQDKYQIDEVL